MPLIKTSHATKYIFFYAQYRDKIRIVSVNVLIIFYDFTYYGIIMDLLCSVCLKKDVLRSIKVAAQVLVYCMCSQQSDVFLYQ